MVKPIGSFGMFKIILACTGKKVIFICKPCSCIRLCQYFFSVESASECIYYNMKKSLATTESPNLTVLCKECKCY